jgi:hypothetical protein
VDRSTRENRLRHVPVNKANVIQVTMKTLDERHRCPNPDVSRPTDIFGDTEVSRPGSGPCTLQSTTGRSVQVNKKKTRWEAAFYESVTHFGGFGSHEI